MEEGRAGEREEGEKNRWRLSWGLIVEWKVKEEWRRTDDEEGVKEVRNRELQRQVCLSLRAGPDTHWWMKYIEARVCVCVCLCVRSFQIGQTL